MHNRYANALTRNNTDSQKQDQASKKQLKLLRSDSKQPNYSIQLKFYTVAGLFTVIYLLTTVNNSSC